MKPAVLPLILLAGAAALLSQTDRGWQSEFPSAGAISA
jgi:hypothetical protein